MVDHVSAAAVLGHVQRLVDFEHGLAELRSLSRHLAHRDLVVEH